MMLVSVLLSIPCRRENDHPGLYPCTGQSIGSERARSTAEPGRDHRFCIRPGRCLRFQCQNSGRRPESRCTTFDLTLCNRPASLVIARWPVCSAYAANPPGIRKARVSLPEALTGVRRVCIRGASAVSAGRPPQQTARDLVPALDGRARKLSEPMNNHSSNDDLTSPEPSLSLHPTAAAGDGQPPDEGTDPPETNGTPPRGTRR